MPAAAVIPATIAYMKVVAVKKLVVGFRIAQDVVRRNGEYHAWVSFLGDKSRLFQAVISNGGRFGAFHSPSFTLRKLECSKQA